MTQNVEDLSALVRRGEATDADCAQLEVLLEASPEDRFFHLAGRASDEADAAETDDPEAIARLLARLAEPRPHASVVRLRRVPVWMAAAATLIVAGAAAAVVSVQRARPVAPRPSASATPARESASRRALAHAPSSAATAPHELASSASSASLETLSPIPSNSTGAAPTAPLAPRSAAQLLSDAGRARREGRAGQAATLLDALQSRFPNSPQAITADITLGSLKLQSGAGGPALAHFDRYLARAPGGGLVPEAMWGRAQALSRLGNGAAARQTLLELVQRFPSSPYTSAANAKLRALEHTP